MQVSYPIIGIVALIAIALIIFLIRRNIKDEKEFEQEVIQSELKPEKHDEDKEIRP